MLAALWPAQGFLSTYPKAVLTDKHCENRAHTGETMSEAHKEDNGNQDDFDAAYEESIAADESINRRARLEIVKDGEIIDFIHWPICGVIPKLT